MLNLLDTQKKNLCSILRYNLSSAIAHLIGCFAQQDQIL